MQVGLHRRHGDSGDVRDLVEGQVVEVAQHHHQAVLLGEGVDRCAHALLLWTFQRRSRPICAPRYRIRAFFVAARRVEELAANLAARDAVAAEVAGDAQDPVPERPCHVESFERFEGVEKRVLDGVLGLVRIAQHAPGKVVGAPAVTLDQPFEGQLVAGEDPANVGGILRIGARHGGNHASGCEGIRAFRARKADDPLMDKPPPPRPALIVHAGAWAVPEHERRAHRRAVITAVELGWQALLDGGSSIDAVKTAVRSMEDDGALNAGNGSVLDESGAVSLDAGIMWGKDLSAGAVGSLRDRLNPIEAADVVRLSKHVLMVGDGASRYLDGHLEKCDPSALIVGREIKRLEEWRQRADRDDHASDFGYLTDPSETVGAVAIDTAGTVAAGASTGGVLGKLPGRVGDTPIPGAGYYADDLSGGAAVTGWGEPILRMGLARRAVELARENNAQDATWLAMEELQKRYEGRGGIVLIARDGSIGYSFNTPFMPLAYMDAELEMPFVGGGV